MSIEVIETGKTTTAKAPPPRYNRREVSAYLEKMQSVLEAQRADVQRLETQKTAMVRTLDVAIAAADELLNEATGTASAIVEDAERSAAEVVEIAAIDADRVLRAAEESAAELHAGAAASIADDRAEVEALRLELAERELALAEREREAADALRTASIAGAAALVDHTQLADADGVDTVVNHKTFELHEDADLGIVGLEADGEVLAYDFDDEGGFTVVYRSGSEAFESFMAGDDADDKARNWMLADR